MKKQDISPPKHKRYPCYFCHRPQVYQAVNNTPTFGQVCEKCWDIIIPEHKPHYVKIAR